MNKCPKCGQEVESKFCPDCGINVAEPPKCPKCGATMTGRFCPDCGYDTETKSKKAPKEKKPNKFLEKVKEVFNKCKTYFLANKKKCIIIGASAIAAITIVIILIATLTNIFRVGKVSKIEIGMNTDEVEKILGEPTIDDDGTWYWFEKNAAKKFKKAAEIEEEFEFIEDENDFEKLEEKYNKIYAEIEEMTYKFIMVDFDSDDKVREVFLDKNHKYDDNTDYSSEEEKEVKKLELGIDFLKGYTVTTDAETVVNLEHNSDKIRYEAKFKDGSYYLSTTYQSSMKIAVNGNDCDLEWNDRITTYKATKPLKITGTIIDGVLTEWYGADESIILPEGVTSVSSSLGNSTIKQITLPAGTTKIEANAFKGLTGLEIIEIPSSVIEFDADAFSSHFGLKSINYIGTIEQWCNIGFAVGSSNPLCYGAKLYLNGELLTELVIPDTVTEIKNYAFYGCDSLTSITIPDSVTTIGYEAFRNCTSLTSVTIGNSVTSIGGDAFDGCSSLTEINFNATAINDLAEDMSIFDGAGRNGDGTTVIIGKNVTKIPAYLFYHEYNTGYTPKITSVQFEEDSVCESIGDYAFAECSSLTSITIPNSVTTIGDYAFDSCSSLASITIPDSVTSIGNSVFNGCSSLTSVTIPDSVTSIGRGAFNGCSSLTSVTIPDSVTSIEYNAFSGCSSLTEINFNATAMNDLYGISHLSIFNGAGQNGNGIKVTIGKNVTKIPDYLFSCSGIDMAPHKIINIEFEEGSVCESIGNSAFYNCSLLTSITIPNSVTTIGNEAFRNCTSLVYNEYDNAYYLGNETNPYLYLVGAKDLSITSCVINENAKFIQHYAFHGCSSLANITIPDSVTTIGYEAFRNCTALTSVTIGNSVTSIGGGAFDGCSSLTEINFNATAMNDLAEYMLIFNGAGQNGNGIKVTIGKNVTKIPAYLFSCGGIMVMAPHKIINIEFEEGSVCESIGNSAFFNCSSLTSITIPDSVTSIGGGAFSGCSLLTSVTIPNSVTSIGDYAFNDCSNLTTINCEATSQPDGWDSDWKYGCSATVNWGYTGE